LPVLERLDGSERDTPLPAAEVVGSGKLSGRHPAADGRRLAAEAGSNLRHREVSRRSLGYVLQAAGVQQLEEPGLRHRHRSIVRQSLS
jgi:hypothetical protein